MTNYTEVSNQEPRDPKLRHEFVGMMFAVTIGEIGLQVAAVVHRGHWVHFLPAYSHLLVATAVVTASWVGWSLSAAPGARRDVVGIFHPTFAVLLLDVALVIVYFIMVRTVDFSNERAPSMADSSHLALWLIVIFVLYLAWDLLTESKAFYVRAIHGPWWANRFPIILPTLLCLSLAFWTRHLVAKADAPHYLTADLAVLFLVLLFRATKELAYTCVPGPILSEMERRSRRKQTILWTVICSVGMAGGLIWTSYSLPLPAHIIAEIECEPMTEAPAEMNSPVTNPYPPTKLRPCSYAPEHR